MAYGDIHNRTGTICKAKSDATCPLSVDGGHSVDLDGYAEVQGVEADILKGLVENANMAPKAALDLMGSGEMADTPPAITKNPYDQIAREKLIADPGPLPGVPAETPQQRYDREMTQYKIDMVKYENRMLEEYAAAQEVAKQSPFAPQPKQPPFRTVYPKSFEAYDQVPKDFLSDEIPADIASQAGGEGLWEEYLRKRKQIGDVTHARGDAPNRILYL